MKSKVKIWVGILWLTIMVLLVIFGRIKLNKNQNMISPLAEIVQASEPKKPEVVISCENPVGYIRCKYYNHELSEDEARIMIAIAYAESGMNPEATNVNKNGTIDRGLFQINSIHKSLSNADAFDFKKNTDHAIKIMRKSGFYPWVVYKTGAYKKHLAKIEI